MFLGRGWEVGNLKQIKQNPSVFAKQIDIPIFVLLFVRNFKEDSPDHEDPSIQNTVNISNKSVIKFLLQ